MTFGVGTLTRPAHWLAQLRLDLYVDFSCLHRLAVIGQHLGDRVDDPSALSGMLSCNRSGSLPRTINLPARDRVYGAVALAGRAGEQGFQGSGGVGVVSTKVHWPDSAFQSHEGRCARCGHLPMGNEMG
jgi:hypothetical protein